MPLINKNTTESQILQLLVLDNQFRATLDLFEFHNIGNLLNGLHFHPLLHYLNILLLLMHDLDFHVLQ